MASADEKYAQLLQIMQQQQAQAQANVVYGQYTATTTAPYLPFPLNGGYPLTKEMPLPSWLQMVLSARRKIADQIAMLTCKDAPPLEKPIMSSAELGQCDRCFMLNKHEPTYRRLLGYMEREVALCKECQAELGLTW